MTSSKNKRGERSPEGKEERRGEGVGVGELDSEMYDRKRGQTKTNRNTVIPGITYIVVYNFMFKQAEIQQRKSL